MLSETEIKRRKFENIKTDLYNDHFQNFKRYGIPKAQLVIADIPYNLGNNAYASSNEWYNGGDIANGESKKANTKFFDTDENFNLVEYMHFCSKLLRKEPKEAGQAPCMIVFCAFQQMHMIIELGKRYGFKHNIPLFFTKKSSAQVLKANMKIVGATEYGLVLYREKLPKFNNDGKMILNHMPFEIDRNYPKIHPTQKPIPLLKKLISIFTDPTEVVIDPCAGSGSTLRAAAELNRNAYGFEIKKDMYEKAKTEMLNDIPTSLFL